MTMAKHGKKKRWRRDDAGKAAARRHREYIGSERWRERRAAYFMGHAEVCHRCGAEHGVELHHSSYERLGNEPDEHLHPLCACCHEAFHHGPHFRGWGTLHEDTLAFIANRPPPKTIIAVGAPRVLSREEMAKAVSRARSHIRNLRMALDCIMPPDRMALKNERGFGAELEAVRELLEMPKGEPRPILRDGHVVMLSA